MFPLRSLIPEKLDGLIAAQKNLGFSSIVSSAVRLHDASMGIGQAAGACAAASLKRAVQPREIPFNREYLIGFQYAIVSKLDNGQPGMLWPFRDLDPSHPSYMAINMLAVQHCLPLLGDEVEIRADEEPTDEWMQSVVKLTLEQLNPTKELKPPIDAKTRGEFARRWWNTIRGNTWKPYARKTPIDADGDAVKDQDDALPLDAKNASLSVAPVAKHQDGLPDPLADGLTIVKQFNFAGRDVSTVQGFVADYGKIFDSDRGFGWKRDLSKSYCMRGKASVLADTYVFTRTHDVWECALPNGKYAVDVSIGDSAFKQFGKNVTVEGKPVFRDQNTNWPVRGKGS